MAAPLFLITALWDRFDLGHRPRLRGRELYEENGAVEVAFAAEQWARSFASNVPDALVLAVVLAVTLTLVIAAYNRRKPRNASTGKAKIR